MNVIYRSSSEEPDAGYFQLPMRKFEKMLRFLDELSLEDEKSAKNPAASGSSTPPSITSIFGSLKKVVLLSMEENRTAVDSVELPPPSATSVVPEGLPLPRGHEPEKVAEGHTDMAHCSESDQVNFPGRRQANPFLEHAPDIMPQGSEPKAGPSSACHAAQNSAFHDEGTALSDVSSNATTVSIPRKRAKGSTPPPRVPGSFHPDPSSACHAAQNIAMHNGKSDVNSNANVVIPHAKEPTPPPRLPNDSQPEPSSVYAKRPFMEVVISDVGTDLDADMDMAISLRASSAEALSPSTPPQNGLDHLNVSEQPSDPLVSTSRVPMRKTDEEIQAWLASSVPPTQKTFKRPVAPVTRLKSLRIAMRPFQQRKHKAGDGSDRPQRNNFIDNYVNLTRKCSLCDMSDIQCPHGN